MKILLVQHQPYLGSHGGAEKANRAMLEGLASLGHDCLALAPGHLLDTAGRGDAGAARRTEQSTINGVQLHAITGVRSVAQLQRPLTELISSIAPDWVLVSSEPAQLLIEAALEAAPAQVVYIVHQSMMLPFGPLSTVRDAAATKLLQRAAGVITVSRYLKEYLERWGELRATVLPFPAYGSGPFTRLNTYDSGAVTMVNPCAIKGSAILYGLAEAMPEQRFAAVPTWGTTAHDRAALARLPNMRLLPAADQIEEILAQTSVLLVPSLWDEAFGLIVVEAMLRGIPVLASNLGGLPEAKQGVDYVLPVRPIERYTLQLDDRGLPIADVPEQDLTPWREALGQLLGDRRRYEQLAEASRSAALAFVTGLGSQRFEHYLRDLPRTAAVAGQTDASGRQPGLTAGLTAQQRALLALRLRQRSRRAPD